MPKTSTTFERAWVKQIGRRRLSDFQRALLDPQLVSMRQELAKIDGRIADLERRAQEGESLVGWSTVQGLVQDLGLLEIGDLDEDTRTARRRELLEKLERATTAGVNDYRLWEEVKDLLELRRKIADTERKYEELHQLLIPYAQMVLLFDHLKQAIEYVLPDRAVQRALLHEVYVRCNGDARDVRQLTPLALPQSFAASAAAPGDDDAAEPEPLADEPDRAPDPPRAPDGTA